MIKVNGFTSHQTPYEVLKESECNKTFIYFICHMKGFILWVV